MKFDQIYNNASKWIKRNARPLECARWSYLFENGTQEDVIHKLEAFQNEDGGFGHGLEPDISMPDSSAIATWTACQVLMEVNVAPSHPIVQKTIQYLVNSYDSKLGYWWTVTPNFNDYPHAPHWAYRENVQESWMFNPSVELASYMIHWSPPASKAAQIGWSVFEKAKERLLACETMDFHEINNYQRAIQLLAHAIEDVELLQQKVKSLAVHAMNKDRETWGKTYSALPLDLISSKEDDLYKENSDVVKQNIDYYIQAVQEDGIWGLTWSWGQYDDYFQISKQQWKGILAVRYVKLIKEFYE